MTIQLWGVRALLVLVSIVCIGEMFMISSLLVSCDSVVSANHKQLSSLASESASAAPVSGTKLNSSKNLITTRFGVLQCRAKTQPRRQDKLSTKSSSKQTANILHKNNNENMKANEFEGREKDSSKSVNNTQGPTVIILPPIDDSSSSSSSSSNHNAENDEQENETSLKTDEIDDEEATSEDNDGTELMDNAESTRTSKRSERRKSSSATSLIWNQFNKFKLRRMRRQKRQKRQAGTITTLTNPDPLEDAAREILGLRPRRPTLFAPEIMQQLVSSMLSVIQQVLSMFVGRSVAELPIRMANFGQLIANVITALTLNNPVLSNSPPIATTATTTTGDTLMNGTAGSDILLNRQSTILDAANRLLRALGGRQQQQQNPSIMDDINLRNAEITTTTTTSTSTTTTTSSPATVSVDSIDLEASNRLQNQQTESREQENSKEVEFVKRLNELTSSSLRSSDNNNNNSDADHQIIVIVNKKKNTNAKQTNKNKNTNKKKKNENENPTPDNNKQIKRRRKRSIGSLLMFGPFSKFYMAMMLNRMLKYQSSVVSQAVMGELVRRFVMPTLTSALIPTQTAATTGLGGVGVGAQSLTAGGISLLGGAFNQMRQNLVGAIASSSNPQQTVVPVPNNRQNKFNSNNNNPTRELSNEENQKGAASSLRHQSSAGGEAGDLSSLLLDADCQLTSENEQPNPQTLLPNVTSPSPGVGAALSSATFAAAMNMPPVLSIDQSGLHIDPPNSALKYTIPNLFNGVQSGSALQTLLGQMTGTIQSGANISSFPLLNQLAGKQVSSMEQHKNNPTSFYPAKKPSHQPSHGMLMRPKLSISSPYDWIDSMNGSTGFPDSNLFSDGVNTIPIWNQHQHQHQQQQQQQHQLQQQVPVVNQSDDGSFLNEFVTKASPNQLFSLLNQLNQQPNDSSTKSTPDLGLLDHLRLASSTGSNHNPMSELDMLSSQQQQQQQTIKQQVLMAPNLGVEDIADSILDKTLGMHMEKLTSDISSTSENNKSLKQAQSNRAEDKLIRETSKLLANSFAQLIRGMNFETTNNLTEQQQHQNTSQSIHQDDTNNNNNNNSNNISNKQSSPIQITLSADEAAKLMDKMLSTVKNNNNNNNSKPQQPNNSMFGSEHQQQFFNGDLERTRRINNSHSGPLKLIDQTDDQQQPDQFISERLSPERQPNNGAQIARSLDRTTLSSPNIKEPVRTVNNRLVTIGKGYQKVIESKTRITSKEPKPIEPTERMTKNKNSTDGTNKVVKQTKKESRSNSTNSNIKTETGASDQPMNNLAMALNIMNMVLLNQRLANATQSSSSSLSSMDKTKTSPNNVNRNSNTSSLIDTRRLNTKKKIPEKAIKSVHDHKRKNGERNTVAPNRPSLLNGDQLERESNHRTSSNRLRSNASLLVVGQDDTKKLPQPTNYHYQPIEVKATLKSDKKQQDKQQIPSEDEHASRWNDVLQHISLTT